jgi:hypothetical protein
MIRTHPRREIEPEFIGIPPDFDATSPVNRGVRSVSQRKLENWQEVFLLNGISIDEKYVIMWRALG